MGTQKVVIPKGLVKPNETTIIEIPGALQNVPTVVARPKPGTRGSPARRAPSPYQGFRPGAASSRGNSPARTPPSVQKYASSSMGTPESYYSRSVSSGGQNRISEEVSYYSTTPEDPCPCSGESSSGGYQRFDSSDSGAYKRFDSDSGGGQITPNDVMNSLSQLESAELNRIMDNLEKFQKARRALVQEASNLPTAGDLSSMLLNP
ncbi:uncharacterized protein LOC103314218 [Tribolium castaneum]|uniref:Uncharacterized protein n=1 Tax=Tribolium castaneum TaxID=7070 RepID=D6X281_TRICA|nr:PREDICTED: uncharacterized protein LOC103314218 [Tribolium castaneum]EFA09897.1 hypothetical protein TcasGA2_TC012047 [Tribolium castaneum]|eukprot:XP_008197814.1 PREDICTED: uncharacterized protein LOC103314218 [Tribolium castaneum]